MSANLAKPRLSVAGEFPLHHFLENLALRPDNSILVTAVQPKALFYLPPWSGVEAVKPLTLHMFDEHVMGIAELEPDVFVVCSSNGYTTHESYLHRLDLRGWTPGDDLKLEKIFTFPSDARALNGCCALTPECLLVADCFAGLIWRVDLPAGGEPKASVWFRHGTMAYADAGLPPPPQPGVNGVRFSKAKSRLYFTTTGQKLFLSVDVDPVNYEPRKAPERITGGGMYDDFCIDASGDAAYLTLHRENRIERVSTSPEAGPGVALASAADDERMLGPSSIAWSRAPGEQGRVAYVTTDGGHTAPPPDGVRPARVLRLELP